MISGWYESEYGAEDIIIDEPIANVSDLAQALYIKYGGSTGRIAVPMRRP